MSEARIRGRRRSEVRSYAAGVVVSIVALTTFGWVATPTIRVSSGDGIYGLVDALDAYNNAFLWSGLDAFAIGLGSLGLGWLLWDWMIERPRFPDRTESTRRPGDRALGVVMWVPFYVTTAMRFAGLSLPSPWPVAIGPSVDGGGFAVIPASWACLFIVLVAVMACAFVIGRYFLEDCNGAPQPTAMVDRHRWP